MNCSVHKTIRGCCDRCSVGIGYCFVCDSVEDMRDRKRCCALLLFLLVSNWLSLIWMGLKWESAMEGSVRPNAWHPFIDYSLSSLYAIRLDEAVESRFRLPISVSIQSVLISLEGTTEQNNSVVWEYGPRLFVDTLKSEYFPSYNHASHRIVYSKRGTTGIAGQMKGVCDSFLLALVKNYSFFFVPNELSEEFLLFPFPAMAIHAVNRSTLHLIDHGSKPYPGIDYEGSLPSNQSLLLLSNHVFAHKLLRFPSNQKQFQRMGVSSEMGFVHPSNRQDVWYNLCIPNMFRPSAKLRQLLQPYESLFASHFMLGIHVRLGGDRVRWHDRTSFMTERGVERAIALLARRIRERGGAVRAFVASDSEALLQRMNALFPGVVFSISSFPLRHVGMDASREGIARCLLDLFLLSRCDELILTRNSHFSMTAAHLASRRIPVTIIH